MSIITTATRICVRVARHASIILVSKELFGHYLVIEVFCCVYNSKTCILLLSLRFKVALITVRKQS